MFILAVNARFGAGIEPLRDAKVLRLVDDPLAGRPARRLRGREDACAPSPIRRPGPAGRPGLGLGTASLPNGDGGVLADREAGTKPTQVRAFDHRHPPRPRS